MHDLQNKKNHNEKTLSRSNEKGYFKIAAAPD